MPLNAKEFAFKAVRLLDEKKAFDITLLDIGSISIVADFFVICNGASRIQTKAICDYLLEKLPEDQHQLLRLEGYQEASWILLDFGDVIIHIFLPEERTFYNLDRLWGSADNIDLAGCLSISSN